MILDGEIRKSKHEEKKLINSTSWFCKSVISLDYCVNVVVEQ